MPHIFTPRLDILPAPQRRLWDELGVTPDHFTLYGGTALALHLGHRQSVDFDFFSREPFDPDDLLRSIPYLADARDARTQNNTLSCRLDRGGDVLISFFGALTLDQIEPRLQPEGMPIFVASLLDLAGTKATVVQKRAQDRDYIDIDALIRHGIDLPKILAAGSVVYGKRFNPVATLKALSYFDDVADLPEAVKKRLGEAVAAVDPVHLPVLVPYKDKKGA